jgi:SNF2 family DNA or RNA helicase
MYLKTPPFFNPSCRYSNPHAHLAQPQHHHHHHHHHHFHQYTQHQPIHSQQSTQSYTYQPQPQQYYRPTDQELQRQNQKDIEMLLSSIPSDVPVLTMRKKKKQKSTLKQLRQSRRSKKKSIVANDGVIEILSDNEQDEEIDELDSSSSSSSSSEEEEEEEEGYVEGLTINLMDHQIKGVSWMIDRENNQSSNGGILADDMGLGKTIQTIGLMASTMAMPELIKKSDQEEAQEEEDQHHITLIITPLALIHQWVDEIKTKTESGKLRVLKHHGPNRVKNPAVLRRYDVIVTTYQVVASDVPAEPSKKKKTMAIDDFIVQEDDDECESTKRDIPDKWQPLKKGYGPLFQINWYRIVLDEAQQIKNRQTKAATACSALTAKKRWCLTGTPIQNNVDELYSLLRFLRIQPLSDYPTFKKNISLPIQNGESEKAMVRLKAVLRAVMLRRTKDVLRGVDSSQQQQQQQQESSHESTPMDSNASSPANNEKSTLHLPSREKRDITLTFSDHERALYNLLKKRSQETIRDMRGQNVYMNMLCLLLRLRQGMFYV